MKKNRIFKILLTLVIIITITFSTSCKKNDKVIKVCASQLPHADILRNCVASILEEQGYTLKVYVLDWTLQNDSVASKDYDAEENLKKLSGYQKMSTTEQVKIKMRFLFIFNTSFILYIIVNE